MIDIKNKKVLFADFDGTLIKTASGKTFAEDCTDYRIRKDVLDKIKRLNKEGNLVYLHIVTNQGGIPKFITEQEFRAKLSSIVTFIGKYINEEGQRNSLIITARYCDSMNPDDVRRKPNTGMLTESLLFPMSADKMFMIGDASGKHGNFSDSDKKTAENFGIDYLDVEDFVSLQLK